MSIHLFLMRHGNTFEAGEKCTQIGLKTDLPLTAKGREQAYALASYLQANLIVPKAIYAGSLKRQIETASIISNELGISQNMYLNEPAFDEIDYGIWEGLTTDEIKLRWAKEYADWEESAIFPEHIFSGSEIERYERISRFLEKLKQNYSKGDVVLAVSSNGNIRYFYSLIKAEWDKLIRERRIQELRVKTGNFCKLIIDENSVSVSVWNKNT